MVASSETLPLPLRPAVLSDVPALDALVNSAYRGDSAKAGWTHEADLLGGTRIDAARLERILAADDQVMLVHEDGGALLACVLVERRPGGGYVGMLTVKPTLQASGMGRRLLAGAEAYARTAWGATFCEMTVIARRKELVAWYERRGYAATGERKAFPKDETVEVIVDDVDMIVMRKELPPA